MFEGSTKKGKILIVEDHRDISDLLSSFLAENGYEAECAYNGREASDLLRDKAYALILMDLMLPYKGGTALISELRSRSDTPVICLSAKSGMETRLEVLKMGADDYILKPFDLNEVLVRIEVVLRRSRYAGEQNTGTKADRDGGRVFACGALQLYDAEHRVEYQGNNIALTSKELQILKLLLEHPTKTYSKANLYESVWQDVYYYEDNTINVHVSNLRNKLKRATGHDYIETVWGIGYRLREE